MLKNNKDTIFLRAFLIDLTAFNFEECFQTSLFNIKMFNYHPVSKTKRMYDHTK